MSRFRRARRRDGGGLRAGGRGGSRPVGRAALRDVVRDGARGRPRHGLLSINPKLGPAEIRELLRRASLPVGGELDFEPTEAEDLTAPILPSERADRLDHRDVGRGARLDMRKTLDLTVESLTTAE